MSTAVSQLRHPADAPRPDPIVQLKWTARKLRGAVASGKQFLKRTPARALYALPFLRHRNPRRRVRPLRSLATRLAEYPRRAPWPKDWYVPIRSAEPISRRDSISLNPSQAELFRQAALRFNDGPRMVLPEVALACFHRAKIYSADFLVLSSEGNILFESALSRHEVLECNGIFDTIIRPAAEYVPGDYSLLGCPWAPRNYYEWMFGVLPRLSVIEQFAELESIPLLLPPRLTAYQQKSLELLGVPAARMVPFDGRCWEVDRLYYPEHLSPIGSPSPHAVRWLQARLMPKTTASRKRRRRLYVTRRDASQRMLLNEGEVIGHLLTAGFEVICPGELSLTDQIAAFAEADVVVGPHGAAFANMLFAPAGATLIELFGNNYIHGCYWALANICSHRHAFLSGPAEGLNYRIPLEQLKQLLAMLGHAA